MEGLSPLTSGTTPAVPVVSRLQVPGGEHPGVTFASAMSFLQVGALSARVPTLQAVPVDSTIRDDHFIHTAYDAVSSPEAVSVKLGLP
jgi:hypothetical protein